MVVDEDLVVNEEEVEVDNTEEEELVENSEVSENEEPENVQDEDEEDRIVSIGDPVPQEEEEHQKAPPWVKKVRLVNRKLEGENKRLKRQIEDNKRAAEISKPVELGEEPSLAGCKYDDVKYKQELRAYDERKRKVDEQAVETAKTVETQNKNWQNHQEKYVNLKQEHNFKDFGETEELVSNTFSITQQSIIVQGAEDAALLVYALGKNPKKLEELSKITDPVDFAFKVAKLESQLKVTSRKAPKPEKRVSGGKAGGMSGNVDKTLEKLTK